MHILAKQMNGGRKHGALKHLANKIGVHPATVTRWGNGEVEIPKLAETAILALIAYEEAEGRLSKIYDALGLE
jgi:hypothetical protein